MPKRARRTARRWHHRLARAAWRITRVLLTGLACMGPPPPPPPLPRPPPIEAAAEELSEEEMPR